VVHITFSWKSWCRHQTQTSAKAQALPLVFFACGQVYLYTVSNYIYIYTLPNQRLLDHIQFCILTFLSPESPNYLQTFVLFDENRGTLPWISCLQGLRSWRWPVARMACGRSSWCSFLAKKKNNIFDVLMIRFVHKKTWNDMNPCLELERMSVFAVSL